MAKRRRPITPIYPYDPLEEYRDEKPAEPISNKKKQGGELGRLPYIAVFMTIITTLCTLVFSVIISMQVLDLLASRKEQGSLLELAENLEADKQNEPNVPYISTFDAEMRQINPDYICWIKIEDTMVDYPVVRGKDNDTYLSLSFYREENTYGSLFMDYRCTGEYVPHLIIYGHNTRTGDMFGGLRKYLDQEYLSEHPQISIKVNDRMVTYDIFNAKKTNIHDTAYDLDFNTPEHFRSFAEKCGAPSDAVQIITLSTCVSAGNDEERIIVQGVLKENKPPV